MSACKTLFCSSLSSFRCTPHPSIRTVSLSLSSLLHHHPHAGLSSTSNSKCYTSAPSVTSVEAATIEEEPHEEQPNDTVQHILTGNNDGVSRLMKMERKPYGEYEPQARWFPYLDRFRCGNGYLMSSGEIVDAVSPCISEARKERLGNVVRNRSYSVCLVVEGLCDFGNVSAAFRSADALGVQSVHVVSCDANKRYKDNRHVSMGAEKWLDIELWDSTKECFKILKSRGYRIATTHVGMNAVSIYDLDWSCPTAIVVGNENRGISDEALELSDLHCSIPMKGMVDSFNVSVAAGILMHHAVCDRISRMVVAVETKKARAMFESQKPATVQKEEGIDLHLDLEKADILVAMSVWLTRSNIKMFRGSSSKQTQKIVASILCSTTSLWMEMKRNCREN